MFRKTDLKLSKKRWKARIRFWEKEPREYALLSRFRQPKPRRIPEVAGKIRKQDWEKILKMAEN